ncbi:MAG: hypothetical protein KJ043_00255 [Anaerolineae bacterium]|nr:hypothetical protein [Anaerolineae bacterium]
MESGQDGLWQSAQTHAMNGAFDQAKETLMALVASAKKAKDYHHHILALTELGKISLLRDGDGITSYAYLTSALKVAKKHGDASLLTQVYRQLGNYGIISQDFRLATRHLTNAVEYARQAGDNLAVCLALSSLCHVRIEQHRYPEAWDYAQAVHETAISIPDGRMTLFGLSLLGIIQLHQHKFEPARDYFLQAVAIQDDTIRPEDKISVQNYLAQSYYLLNDNEHAYQMWQTALKTGIQFQILPEITRSLVGLVVISDSLAQKNILKTILHHPACHWEARQMAESIIGTTPFHPNAPQTSTTTLLDIAHQLKDTSS